MHNPQSGIFALGTGSRSYLEFQLQPDCAPLPAGQAVATLVAGFRPSLWAAVASGDLPAALVSFDTAIQGTGGFQMPATQQDVWIRVAGHAYDKVFDVTRETIAALGPADALARETAGWTYKESGDLTGFIDATENPGMAIPPEVAVVPRRAAGRGHGRHER